MLRLGPVFTCRSAARERRESAMGNASSDRTRMRHDLRELAKLASPTESGTTPSQGHGFETADSSGYVDLSAFSATDDKWIERELARAGGRAQGGAVLTPGSMAPVAMTALLDAEPEDTGSTGKRGRVYWALAIGGIAAVAALAVVLARHRPAPTSVASQSATMAPAATPAPPPVATPAPSPAVPDAPPAVASASAAPPVTASAPDPSPASKKHAARAHGARSAPPPAPAPHAAVAVRSVSIPPAKSSGGDSLMDMMRASINGSKK
jgi:hypothetical protein